MKRILVAFVFATLTGCIMGPASRSAISPNPVVPFPDHGQWVLLTGLTYTIGKSYAVISIPEGFVTDYASIPRAIWSFASPHDVYSEPSIVHDYLYWTQSCTRLQADNIFLIAMKEAEVDSKTAWAVYRGVRGGGQSSWDSNADEYKAGLPRIIPRGRENLTSKSKWSFLRMQLFYEGVRDIMPEKNLPYCSLGDSTEVPVGPR
jgi:hypothetical protein